MWVMFMYEEWNNIIINKISIAVEVKPGEGKSVHIDRPFHGLVLTDGDMVIDYHFSDGKVLHVDENSVFYLPKGSTYRAKDIKKGHCFAINFDADIECEPFSVPFRSAEAIQKIFKSAIAYWNNSESYGDVYFKKSLYEIIYLLLKELKKDYLPNDKESRIKPAEEILKSSIFSEELQVSYLAKKCKMSETYFRKIFSDKYGLSPKKYIIRQKINYAKKLLLSGDMSVEEVCEKCGYSDVSLFSREFKKEEGVAPSVFKNSI